MPGRHNALNATAAIAVAYELGVERQPRSRKRWPISAACGGVSPAPACGTASPLSTITATTRSRSPRCCKAARELTKGQVIAVVQPHRYTRLAALFEQFCTCFNDADAVIVAHVYPAGEAPIEGADRDALVQGLRTHGHRHVIPLDSPERLASHVAGMAQAGDYVVLPRRRLDHAMGLCAARRIGGAVAHDRDRPPLLLKKVTLHRNNFAKNSDHEQRLPGGPPRCLRGSRTARSARLLARL